MIDIDKVMKSSLTVNFFTFMLISLVIIFAMIIVMVFSSAENSTQAVQVIYQIGLLIAGLIGLPLAIWRSLIAHRQWRTSSLQLEGFNKQIGLLEAGAEADRLQKGAELLGAEGLAVRIAGVSILRGIAVEKSHKFQREAFDILHAFAQSISRDEELRAKKGANDPSPTDLIETFNALRVSKIGSQTIGNLVIRRASFSNIRFPEWDLYSVDFLDCFFHDCTVIPCCGADFINSSFFDSKIVLDEDQYTTFDRCNFSNCKIEGRISADKIANCEFRRCSMSDLQTNGTLNTKD